MITFPRALLSVLVVALVAVIAPLQAEEAKLAVGGTVPVIVAKDQHEKDFTLGDDTVYLLVSFDMGTGKAANGKLEKKGAGWLEGRKAVFLSNIHGMPGVGRVFALPKMRRYPHRIILADADGLLDPFPESQGKVTVLKLKPGRVIESITTWDPRKEDVPL